MLSKLLLLFILFNSILCANAFKLTNKDKIIIKNSANKRASAKRFINLYKFIKKANNFGLKQKLLRTNLYINKIISKNDDNNTNKWSTPKEFLINGYGDCEDYAIAKYFVLKELNIDTDKLYLSVVKIKGSKNFHMVLMYLNKLNIPLILDNLSWRVLNINKRHNLKFKYAFNDKASYIFNDKGMLIKEINKKRPEVYLFRKIIKNEDF